MVFLIKDITGNRYGKLTALYPAYRRKGKVYWHCRCDCGNEKDVSLSHLTSGSTKSCGCIRSRKGRKFKKQLSNKEFIGKRFGMLTVESLYEYKDYKSYWKCKCDCGNYTVVARHNLVGGDIISCGCKQRRKSLAGKKFGKLIVLDKNRCVDGKYYCLCRCDCGKVKYIRYDHLVNGETISCGCLDISHGGSSVENYIKNYVTSLLPNEPVEKARILDGKEIDIYFPNLKFGIEYNGSPFHASENGVYKNLDKYYHRNKFLLARNKGIKLISIFDKYFEDYDEIQLNIIKDVINNVHPFIPMNEIEYTNNNYDYGLWMKNFGYTEVGQEEPREYNYGDFKGYDCGRTIWRKECY